jgi:hypothetical protein
MVFAVGVDSFTVTIASGTSLSPAVQIGAKVLVGPVLDRPQQHHVATRV